jgi:hypothetical protein
VPVKYGCSPKKARQLLERALQDVCGGFVEQARQEWAGMLRIYKVEPAKVDPMVSLVANDNWMEFTLRYVVPYTRRRTTRTELFERILEDIEAANGEVALASATFQLVEAPAFEVRVKSR